MARAHRTPSAEAPLTPAEQVFVEQYLVDLNGTRAYRVAFPGAAYGSARALASKLVAKVNVAAEIRAARAAQQRRTQITADKALRELARVAFSDLIDLFDGEGRLRSAREMPLDARRAAASVKVSRERVARRVTRRGKTTTTTTVRECVIEVKFWDKVAALERLFRHLGLETPIPPLEALLRSLPPRMAAGVRAALA